MMRFNFLPWREERRHQNKAIFNRVVSLHIALALSVVLVVWFVNEEQRNLTCARLALVVSLTAVLASGLGILGVSAPEEMR